MASGLGRLRAMWIVCSLAIIGTLLLLAVLALVDVRHDEGSESQVGGGVEQSPPPTTSSRPVEIVPPAPRPVDDRELLIFLQPVATAAQIDAVRQSLKGMTEVRSVRFVDKAEAYAEMKAMFADDPDVLGSISRANAPVNFHVLPQPDADRHVIGERLAAYKGVLRVVYPGE